MSRRIVLKEGQSRAELSGELAAKVERLLDSETYRPILRAMEREMQQIVENARSAWPVGRGVLRAKQERAQGTLGEAFGLRTTTGYVHSRDRFHVEHQLLPDSIRVVATNSAPYVRYIKSWKIGMSTAQITDVIQRAKAQRADDAKRRKGLLRDYYRDWGPAIRRREPHPSFATWLGRSPYARVQPLWTYIDLPRRSPLQELLRKPQREAADRLAATVGPMLLKLVEQTHG